MNLKAWAVLLWISFSHGFNFQRSSRHINGEFYITSIHSSRMCCLSYFNTGYEPEDLEPILVDPGSVPPGVSFTECVTHQETGHCCIDLVGGRLSFFGDLVLIPRSRRFSPRCGTRCWSA